MSTASSFVQPWRPVSNLFPSSAEVARVDNSSGAGPVSKRIYKKVRGVADMSAGSCTDHTQDKGDTQDKGIGDKDG